jgi:hypothetical protein
MTFLEAVQSLGQTQESIMQVLREKGIKGTSCRPGSCPIARYLNSCGFPSVSVGHTSAYYYHYDGNTRVGELVDFPPEVGKWIFIFDHGGYSEFRE